MESNNNFVMLHVCHVFEKITQYKMSRADLRNYLWIY